MFSAGLRQYRPRHGILRALPSSCFVDYRRPITSTKDQIMQMARLGSMDLPTALTLVVGAAVCYAAWLTSIVFCAVHGARPLLIAAASFFPVGIVHGVGIWFGGW